MKKLFSFILFFLLSLFIASSVRAEEIKNFKSVININKDGTIDVQETIAYDFGELDRHGIFRTIPYITTNKSGKKFVLGFNDISVTDERGKNDQYSQSKIGENFQLKIGDPDRTITGLHNYIINYRVSGALTYFSDHDELYWNITGNDWGVWINSAETEINLPFITQGKEGPLHLVKKLSRAKLETIVGDLIEKTIPPVEACLKDAGIDKSKIDEIVLVGGMTRMPRVLTKVKEFFGKEPNKSVNPDEVVAIGAAVQAGVLTGEVKDVVLLDVTPLTLGVETLGAVATPLIKRNTTVPTSKSEIFSTAADNQTSVEINILQGERPMAADNKSLGRFILDGIPPAPRGVPQVEVSFDIDANGILNVSAKDKATGKSQSVRITSSTGLSTDEIEKMTKEADEHAKEDQEKKEKIEARNKADNMIYVAEKSLKDAEGKVSDELKKEVEDKVSSLKGILDSASREDLETKTKDLSDTLSKIGQAMYQNQQTQPPPSGEQPTEEKEEKNGEEKKSKKKSKEDVQEGEVVS